MKISETDFNLLSALIDDELSADEKANMLQRLQTDEALQRSFVELQQLKYSMQSSYKQTLAKRSTPQALVKKRFSFLPIAACLSVIGITLSTSFYYFNSAGKQSVLSEIHQNFSQSEYQFAAQGRLKAVQLVADQTFIVPDLSHSNLYLVAQQRDENSEQLLHYRGTNGCKLTLRMQDGSELQKLEAEQVGVQQYQWLIAGQAYQVIATGMDQSRFDAIANYIQQLSRSVAGLEKYQIAMQQSYQEALPCA